MTSSAKQQPLIENLRNLFAQCDTDKSGSLSRDEFRQLCLKIGLNEAIAAKTFERLDSDKDERITFEEFSSGFQRYQQTAKASASPQIANRRVAQSQPQTSKSPTSSRQSPSLMVSKKSASPLGVIAIADNETDAGPTRTTHLDQQQQQQPVTPNPFNDISGPNSVEFDHQTNNNNKQNCTNKNKNNSTHNNLTSSSSVSSSPTNEFVVYTNENELAATTQNVQQQCSNSNLTDYYISSNSRSNSQFSSLTNGCDSASLNGQLRSMQDFMDCLQKLQSENQMLSQVLLKDRKDRDVYISQLGEEFESQVKQVEERYSRKARDEVESERKKYKQMIQVELDKLQSHYAQLESMANSIKLKATNSNKLNNELNDLNEDVNYKLENTSKENRKLEKSLQDTKNEVASIRQEMKRLKNQYEHKLKTAYAKNDETLNKCDDIKQQLNSMKDSNKKLQDTSDAITSYITQTVEPVLKNAITDEEGNLVSLTSNASMHGNEYDIANRRGSILSDYLLEKNNSYDDDGGGCSIVINAKCSTKKTSALTSLQSDTVNATIGEEETDFRSHELISRKLDTNEEETKVKNDVIEDNSNFINTQEVGAKSTKSAFEISSSPLATSEPVALETIKEVRRDDEPVVEEADGEVDCRFHVILVGDSFVGKSSFASRFMGGTFKQGLISNCSIDFSTKNYKVDGVNYGIDLWDTAGQERFRSITASYFRKADGIVLMYDVTEKRSYLNVRNWMSTIADSASENVVVLLVGNKIDLRTEQNIKNCVPYQEGARLASEYDILFLETSVKTGENLLSSVGRLIKLIAKKKSPIEEDKDKIKLNEKNRTFACMPKNC